MAGSIVSNVLWSLAAQREGEMHRVPGCQCSEQLLPIRMSVTKNIPLAERPEEWLPCPIDLEYMDSGYDAHVE